MSLLLKAMKDCSKMDRTKAPDGYGGFYTKWSEVSTFQAAFAKDSSLEARRAEKEGIRNIYSIYTHRSVVLENGDIIKRKPDGSFFKITSDGVDKATPESAGLNMRYVTAELLEQLPREDNDNG